MYSGMRSVNFNELHMRETFVVLDLLPSKDYRFHYALAVTRNRENVARTPYMCYYVGLTADEFDAFRQLPADVLANFSFFGIPNDTIDVSQEVHKVLMEDKPMGYVGIDSRVIDERAFADFVAYVIELKEFIRCNPNGLSSLSSKTPLGSPKVTKESSDALPAPLV